MFHKKSIIPATLIRMDIPIRMWIWKNICTINCHGYQERYFFKTKKRRIKKNAQKYLKNTPIIRGINGTELVDLILKYYEDLSEKYRKMIPLKMVYIPVAKDYD